MFNLKNRLRDKINSLIEERIVLRINEEIKYINEQLCLLDVQQKSEMKDLRANNKEHSKQVEGYLENFNLLVKDLISKK